MKTYLKIAWRNLWRNKKRTLISAASVFFAVILALITRSMQEGSYEFIIDSSVRLYTGYVQVHADEYWEKKSLEESMILPKSEIQKINSLDEVSYTIPRLETFSLLSSGENTKVAQVTGIEPDIENKMNSLEEKLTAGKYLKKGSKKILLGEGLAKLLKVNVGDTIVIYGQGYHGVTAADRSVVGGILKFSLPELNKSFSYLDLDYAQWLFSADKRLTSLSIMTDDIDKVEKVKQQVREILPEVYEVMDWQELMPELVQSIEVDNASGIIMLGILYIVIGFGIFGTVMMMTAERNKEFGILISVGMKKWKLVLVTTFETIMISFVGVLAGAVVSIPLLLYFFNNPIQLSGDTAEALLSFGYEPVLPFAFNAGIYFAQIWTVLLIAVLSAGYPLNFIRKLKPVEAIRG